MPEHCSLFSPLPPTALIPALLSIPTEVDSKPKSLDIVNRDAGPEPWGGMRWGSRVEQAFPGVHAFSTLGQQIGSALGCEIKLMAKFETRRAARAGIQRRVLQNNHPAE